MAKLVLSALLRPRREGVQAEVAEFPDIKVSAWSIGSALARLREAPSTEPKSSLGRPRSLLRCQIVLLLKQTHRRDEKAGALPWRGTARTAEGGGCPGPGDPPVRNRCNPIHAHTCTSILLA